jgi:hypothetical protein
LIDFTDKEKGTANTDNKIYSNDEFQLTDSWWLDSPLTNLLKKA